MSSRPVSRPELANLQSWFAFLTGPEVEIASRGRIRPLTAAEACGFLACMVIVTAALIWTGSM